MPDHDPQHAPRDVNPMRTAVGEPDHHGEGEVQERNGENNF
jgi:hypothetical protein